MQPIVQVILAYFTINTKIDNLISLISLGNYIFYVLLYTGFDIDPSALALSVQNASDRDLLDRCDFILCDVANVEKCVQPKRFDTVIMNPPFGTREKGADIKFLKVAFQMANKAVYSLHKTSTRRHVTSAAKRLGVHSKVVAELKFDLPSTYKFHKHDSVDVKVDLIRFVLTPPEPNV